MIYIKSAIIVLFISIFLLTFCDGPDENSGNCGRILTTFENILKSAPGTCREDNDCSNYPILVNCGGIVDQGTFIKLRALERQYYAEGCEVKIRCAAKRFKRPVCEQGRCTGR